MMNGSFLSYIHIKLGHEQIYGSSFILDHHKKCPNMMRQELPGPGPGPEPGPGPGPD